MWNWFGSRQNSIDDCFVFGQSVYIGQLFDLSSNQFLNCFLPECRFIKPSFETQTDFKSRIVYTISGLNPIVNILNSTYDEFVRLLLFNPDIAGKIIQFLIPPVNDFVLARYEKIVELRESSSGEFYPDVKNPSKSLYVSKIKTGVIVLLRVVPKFPVDLKSVIHVLEGKNSEVNDADFIIETLTNWTILEQHDTLKGAMDYIEQIDDLSCTIRCQLKPNGKNVTVPDFKDFCWKDCLEQLHGAELCCIAVEDFLQKVEGTVPFYPGSFLKGLFPKVSENLKQHLEFYQASNLPQLCRNILSMYPDLFAFRHYSYQEIYQFVAKFYDNGRIQSFKTYSGIGTPLHSLICDLWEFKRYQFRRIDGKLFVIVDTEKQKYLTLWDSPIIVVNGSKNVLAILDIYDKLESKNYFFAIFSDPDVFNDRFYETQNEKIVFSKWPHCLGLMKMKPIELTNKMKESNERFEKICSKNENSKIRRWICNNCFQFVGRVGTNLLCECGESLPENCQVKCFHENHGDEWIPLVETKKIEEKEELKPQLFGKSKNPGTTENKLLVESQKNNSNVEEKKNVSELRISKTIAEINLQKPSVSKTGEKGNEQSNAVEIKCSSKYDANHEVKKVEKIESKEEQCNKKENIVMDNKPKFTKPKTEDLPISLVSDECRDILKPSSKFLRTDNCYNILVVGQSGVGKSSLLNAFKNYLLFPTADDALKNRLEYMVPCKFPVYYEDGTEKLVVIGEDDVNEHYQSDGNNTGSTTQCCKIHPLVFGDQRINFIDTPGLTDTRGMDQDNKNLKMIYETITSLDKIHAVCFVLKPNEIKLGVGAERALSDLLSLFPKTVMSRVIFLMTYAKGTFFRPGSTVSALAKFSANLKETRGVELPKITKETVFCFDNEAFRYLCAKEKNIEYPNATLDDYKFSWDNSRDATLRFFNQLKILQPLLNIGNLFHARQLLLEQLEFIKENYLKETVIPDRPYLLVGYYLVAKSLDNTELALYGKNHLNCIDMKKLEEFLKEFKLTTPEEKTKFLAFALKKFQTTSGHTPSLDSLLRFHENNGRFPYSVVNFQVFL